MQTLLNVIIPRCMDHHSQKAQTHLHISIITLNWYHQMFPREISRFWWATYSSFSASIASPSRLFPLKETMCSYPQMCHSQNIVHRLCSSRHHLVFWTLLHRLGFGRGPRLLDLALSLFHLASSALRIRAIRRAWEESGPQKKKWCRTPIASNFLISCKVLQYNFVIVPTILGYTMASFLGLCCMVNTAAYAVDTKEHRDQGTEREAAVQSATPCICEH